MGIRYAASNPPWTPAGIADVTNLTDAGHLTVQGGGGTMRLELLEVLISGQAGASAPTPLYLGRNVVVGGTLSVGRLAALDPSTTAPGTLPTAYNTATTKPQRSSTTGMLLALGLNAYGGQVRWYRGPEEIISLLGNTAVLGELSLNCYTGGTPGLVQASMTLDIV